MKAATGIRAAAGAEAAATGTETCVFCQIVRGALTAHTVFEDAHCQAFLDARPLFVGHVLLVPKAHHETLDALPPALGTALFREVAPLSRAVVRATGAEGYFVACNNRVSQSVPHVHIHIVPRKKGDGLKGFFWPRQKYRDAAHIEETRAAIAGALRV